jgi:hypothetical protein
MKRQKNNLRVSRFVRRAATEMHWGHLAIIGTFAVVLLGTMVLRNQISLNPFRANANDHLLTYEEAKAQVAAEMGTGNSEIENALRDQLALVDPSLGDPGRVLGMTTGLDIAEPLESKLPPGELDKIRLTTTEDNSVESFKRYSEKIIYIESANNLVSNLIALNSDDLEKLKNISTDTRKMVGMMKSVEVPSALQEYHKLKMVYYVYLGYTGEALAQTGTVQLDQVAKDLLSIMERLGAIKLEIYNQYGVIL